MISSSASDKAKLFAKDFSKNSNLYDTGISLPGFSYRTNMKLHNIHVTPKLFKKVITKIDLSKVSGHDCIPVVVSEKCQKESCFQKVSSVVPVFKNVGSVFG